MRNKSEIIIHNMSIEQPKQKSFPPHRHKNLIEIILFIKGNASWIVENSAYSIEPYDILLASPFETHHILHHSDETYERIIISFPSSFFSDYNCEEYSPLFLAKEGGQYNHISHSFINIADIMNCLERLMHYYNAEEPSVLIHSILIEFLHHIHNSGRKLMGNYDSTNDTIRRITTYINRHLTNPDTLTLEQISSHFYINKSYLCRIFKKYTGKTINQYITHRRLFLVRELCSRDVPLTQACFEAGFCNYSTFYRAYCRQYGTSPRKDIYSPTVFQNQKGTL